MVNSFVVCNLLALLSNYFGVLFSILAVSHLVRLNSRSLFFARPRLDNFPRTGYNIHGKYRIHEVFAHE